MNNTSIPWTNYSVNPLKMQLPDGTLLNVCIHKSEGCRHCYAEALVRRWWRKDLGPFPGYTAALLKLGKPFLVEKELLAVLALERRIRAGKADPEKNRIFWSDMTDEYLDYWPDHFLDMCWAVRAITTSLIHQVLTKRPERLLEYASRHSSLIIDRLVKTVGLHLPIGTEAEFNAPINWPLPNVHVLVSVEDQPTADERIPILLKTPAAIRGVSAEPLLGPIDFTHIDYSNLLRETLKESVRFSAQRRGQDVERAVADAAASIPDPQTLKPSERPYLNVITGQWFDGWDSGIEGERLDWVIPGGESGPGFRVMDVDAFTRLVDQCLQAGIPVFTKQDSGPYPDRQGRIPDRYWIRQFPKVA